MLFIAIQSANRVHQHSEEKKTQKRPNNFDCDCRSAVKSPPVVKSSPPIVKRSRPFAFDAVWSKAAYPVVQNYMQGAPRCQTLPKDFGITEMYRIARHPYCQTSVLPDIRIFHRTRMEITGL